MNTNETTCVLDAIDNECARHLDEGYTPGHDDTHTDRSLLRSAIEIAIDVISPADTELRSSMMHGLMYQRGLDQWPIELAKHVREKYGSDEERRLVIAASMIVKEIYRMRRAKR